MILCARWNRRTCFWLPRGLHTLALPLKMFQKRSEQKMYCIVTLTTETAVVFLRQSVSSYNSQRMCCVQGCTTNHFMFSFLQDKGVGTYDFSLHLSLWNLTTLSGMTIISNSPTHHVAHIRIQTGPIQGLSQFDNSWVLLLIRKLTKTVVGIQN